MLQDVLKNLRKINGYTQEEVAEKIGVSRQAVAKWECGRSAPDLLNCREICRLYHVDLNELVKADENDSRSLPPIGKYIFGYVRIDDEGRIKLPAECLEKMCLRRGDSLICLGDLTQGIALVSAETYEEFARKILTEKEKSHD